MNNLPGDHNVKAEGACWKSTRYSLFAKIHDSAARIKRSSKHLRHLYAQAQLLEGCCRRPGGVCAKPC
jgi:hypothetical protein